MNEDCRMGARMVCSLFYLFSVAFAFVLPVPFSWSLGYLWIVAQVRMCTSVGERRPWSSLFFTVVASDKEICSLPFCSSWPLNHCGWSSFWTLSKMKWRLCKPSLQLSGICLVCAPFFHRSTAYPINCDEDEVTLILQEFQGTTSLPSKYLGLPLCLR